MKKLFFLLFLALFVTINFSCDDDVTEPDSCDDDTTIVAYKPNIYIYPEQTLNLSVGIEFPNGGKVINSIPEYNGNWNITVTSSGKIDEVYDFLFYECEMPNLTQKDFGWVIAKDKLKDFFTKNLSESGFNEKEVLDFTNYWIDRLTDYEYYEIYPQYKTTLDEMVKINFSIAPNNFFRLFYLVKGRNDKSELNAPIIQKANREKYFAMEWGVIF